jgi:hypothetical protein
MTLQDIGSAIRRIEFLMEEQKMLLDEIKTRMNNHEYNEHDYKVSNFTPLPTEENGDVEYYDPDGWN